MHQLTDFPQLLFDRNAFLREQTRIRRDAIDDAPLEGALHLSEVRSIKKKLHSERWLTPNANKARATKAWTLTESGRRQSSSGCGPDASSSASL